MEYLNRKPSFRVTIVRPRYTSPSYLEDAVYTFDSNDTNVALIGYQYQAGLEDFSCPFSLTFAPIPLNKNRETIMDKVRMLDVVKIEEHKELKYIGVIEDVRYGARMSESGPDRMITVQGYGVGGVLDQFAMLLDQVILSDAKTTIQSMNAKVGTLMADLSAQYNKPISMVRVLDVIKSSFKEAMEKVGGYSPNTGIFSLVDQYLQFGADTYGGDMDAMTTYPLALSLFSYGAMTLGDAWRGIVTKPFYEMYTRWDSVAGAWIVIVRPTPFSPSAWLKLPKTTIDPVHVESFDCGFSSRDVKTFFFSYLSGGAISYERARGMYQATAIKRDPAKWALYGYRPLEASFRFVNQVELAKNDRKLSLAAARTGDVNGKPETISDETLMERYSSMLQRWFGRADEMLSGSIDMMTMPKGPKIGERVVFNKAEFYVESISCSWQYGGKMSTVLKLTRGGIYNDSFASGTGPNGEDVENDQNWWFRKATMLGDRLELKREGS